MLPKPRGAGGYAISCRLEALRARYAWRRKSSRPSGPWKYRVENLDREILAGLKLGEHAVAVLGDDVLQRHVGEVVFHRLLQSGPDLVGGAGFRPVAEHL